MAMTPGLARRRGQLGGAMMWQKNGSFDRVDIVVVMSVMADHGGYIEDCR